MSKENTEEIQEDTLSDEDRLQAAAEEAAAEELTVKTISVTSEEELEDYDFYEDVADIVTETKIPIDVLEFDHPQQPGKIIRYAMRQLTAKEHAEIFDTLFNADIIKSALEQVVDEDMDSGDPAAMKDAAIQSAIDSIVENQDPAEERQRSRQRITAAIQRCMLRPKKKSLESIDALSDDMRSKLYQSCMKSHDQVWRFQ